MTSMRAVLFADADPATAAGQSPGWRGALNRLGGAMGSVSAAGRAAIERELSAALGRLLEMDLGDLLVAGLRRHPALVAAARATESNPTAVEVVQLAAHRITAGHHPYVDIVVNGATVATVHFDLEITFDVDILVGTVRLARLTNVQSGRCTATAALGCEGHEIVTRQVHFDPALTIRLGDGIALLADERRPAPA